MMVVELHTRGGGCSMFLTQVMSSPPIFEWKSLCDENPSPSIDAGEKAGERVK